MPGRPFVSRRVLTHGVAIALCLLTYSPSGADPWRTNHAGDVFLRLDDTTGGSRVYRFDAGTTPAFVDRRGIIWEPSTRSEGLSVDKFEQILTVQEASRGGWTEAVPAIGRDQVLEITSSGRTVHTLPGPSGYLLAVPGANYVPGPEREYQVLTRVGTSTVGRGCGSTFFPNPRIRDIFAGTSKDATVDGPNRTGVVVGLNHWFISSRQTQTAWRQWGNTAVRHVNAKMREEHRQIRGWLDGADAIPGLTPGERNVGNAILTGVETKTDVDLFSSCGDRCLVGASRIEGSPQRASVPTKFMFSSDGLTPQAQKIYFIKGESGTPTVKRVELDAGGNWVEYPLNTRIIDLARSGTVKTFGNAANIAALTRAGTDDYIYTSDAEPTHFAVATRFWRNGGTAFTYVPARGSVEWLEDYPESPGFNARGELRIWDGLAEPGRPVISIAADGRGNVYYLQNALDPPNRTEGGPGVLGMPDFSSVDPNDPASSRYYVSHTDSRPQSPDAGAHWVRLIRVRQYPVFRLRSTNYISDGHRAAFADVTRGGFQERGTLSTGYFTYEIAASAPMSLPQTGPFSRGAGIENASVSASVGSTLAGWGSGSVSAGSISISGNRFFSSSNTMLTTEASVDATVTASIVVSSSGRLPGSVAVPVDMNVSFEVVLSEFVPARRARFTAVHSETVTLTDANPSAVIRQTFRLSRTERDEQLLPIGAPGAYSFSLPLIATQDPTGIQLNEFKVDVATINVTEPPVVPSQDTRLDLEWAGERAIEEDSAPAIRVENPPKFTGQFTTARFGQANVVYDAPGQALPDADGDGRLGHFAYSAIKDQLEWRWLVRAISHPISLAYNDGAPAAFRQGNDGVAFRGDWHRAADLTGTAAAQPLPMRFNDPTVVLAFARNAGKPDRFEFRDPGRYRVEIQVRGRRWIVPPNLDSFSTPDAILEGDLGDTQPLSYYEDFDVRTVGHQDKEHPIWDIAVAGPAGVTEDRSPPHSQPPYPAAGPVPNWYAQFYVQWYGATDYTYDREIGDLLANSPDWGRVQEGLGPNGRKMYKFDGVGIFDYRGRTAGEIAAQDGDAARRLHEDGHANEQTRVDRLTKADWALIGYTWYLKVRNPRYGMPAPAGQPAEPEFLPGASSPFGHEIVSGNLAELVDLERQPALIPRLTDGNPGRARVLEKDPSPAPAVPPGKPPRTAAERERLYKVTLPLMRNSAFAKLKLLVPTDPTRVRLTVRLRYPQVKWICQPPCTREGDMLKGLYYALAPFCEGVPTIGPCQVSRVYPGKYRFGAGTAADEPKLGAAVSADDETADDDYIETLVQDATPPWVSGAGFEPGRLFDPTNYGSNYQTRYSTSLAGQPAQEEIVTGGVIRFRRPLDASDSGAHTLATTVVDNNPYEHLPRGVFRDPPLDSQRWPRLAELHYEVGDDPRTRDPGHGGVGLTRPGALFGFAIGRTDDSRPDSSFTLDRHDFGGPARQIEAADGLTKPDGKYLIADPFENDLPMAGDFLYPSVPAQDAQGRTRPSIAPYRDVLSYGVTFQTTRDGLPVFDASSSFSKVATLSTWFTFEDASAAEAARGERQNYRLTVWKITDDKLPTPIFLQASSETLSFGADAWDRAPSVNPDPPASANPSRPATIGNYQVVDRDPPNLWIEVIDYKTASPIYFTVQRDWARELPGPGVDLSRAFAQFKASTDVRPVYRGTEGARPPDKDFPASYTRMPDTTSLQLFEPAQPGFQTLHAYNPPSFVVKMEQNVRFRISTKAVDNSSPATGITLRIESRGGRRGQPFPRLERSATIAGSGDPNVATLTGTHFYPSAGEIDDLEIFASDAGGNSRRVLLRLETTPHETEYRVIGQSRGPVR